MKVLQIQIQVNLIYCRNNNNKKTTHKPENHEFPTGKTSWEKKQSKETHGQSSNTRLNPNTTKILQFLAWYGVREQQTVF